jgi:hypothetical protein
VRGGSNSKTPRARSKPPFCSGDFGDSSARAPVNCSSRSPSPSSRSPSPYSRSPSPSTSPLAADAPVVFAAAGSGCYWAWNALLPRDCDCDRDSATSTPPSAFLHRRLACHLDAAATSTPLVLRRRPDRGFSDNRSRASSARPPCSAADFSSSTQSVPASTEAPSSSTPHLRRSNRLRVQQQIIRYSAIPPLFQQFLVDSAIWLLYSAISPMFQQFPQVLAISPNFSVICDYSGSMVIQQFCFWNMYTVLDRQQLNAFRNYIIFQQFCFQLVQSYKVLHIQRFCVGSAIFLLIQQFCVHSAILCSLSRFVFL